MLTNNEFDKICNIAGYPMYRWTAAQIQKRSEILQNESRSDSDLLYLANRGSWFRAVSSIDLFPLDSSKGVLYAQPSQIIRDFQQITPENVMIKSMSDLAKNYILFGGVSAYAQPGGGLRSGIDPNGAYGMLGSSEVHTYGYKPMPGITSATVETTGKMGSLRQATINFKVWNKQQLDIIDALYFRPGYSILLEWGHTKYYTNSGNLESSEQFMIDPFTKKMTKEEIAIRINSGAQKSHGNYGGMLGLITQFNFTMTQDGGFDCTVKALAMGAVMGDLKLNHPTKMARAYEQELKVYFNRKYKELQDVALKTLGAADAQAQAELDKKDSSAFFSKLKIDDPFTTLLYNTGNISIDPINQAVGDTIGAKEKLMQAASNYKDTKADISYMQYVETGSTMQSNDKFYNASFTTTAPVTGYANGVLWFDNVKEYINHGQDMLVTLNFAKLENDFYDKFGKLPNDPTAKKSVSDYFFTTQVDNPGKFITYGSKNSSVTDLISGSAGVVEEAYFSVRTTFLVDASKKSATSEAISAFEDPATKYKVEILQVDPVKDSRYGVYVKLSSTTKSNDKIYIELGLAPGEDSDVGNGGSDKAAAGLDYEGRYYLPDLSLITSIDVNSTKPPLVPDEKNLTKDKLTVEYNAQVQQAKDQYNNAINNASQTYDFDQFKASLDSESALEMMLKSMIIYADNHTAALGRVNPNVSIDFFKNLFQDGAYSKALANILDQSLKPVDLSGYYKSYYDGSLDAAKRLEINLRYGNNSYIMSGENLGDDNIFQSSKIPQVDFEKLFTPRTFSFGNSMTVIEDSSHQIAVKEFVYIPLGLFMMMLNHTAILYNSQDNPSADNPNATLSPMAYIDFNQSTNFYQSSVNQISLDPNKFLVAYKGRKTDYKKLFDSSLIKGDYLQYQAPADKGSSTNPVHNKSTAVSSSLWNPEDGEKNGLSSLLPNPHADVQGKSNPYIGRTMEIMVNVQYLLKIIKDLSRQSDTYETYFQGIMKTIVQDINKCMGGYNALRVAYNDNANCYSIVDDQLIPADPNTAKSSTIGTSCEIPVFGKGSVARAFDIRTDISSRVSSMLAISANPGGTQNQVGMSRDNSDFGIYNYNFIDRYKPYTVDNSGTGKDKFIAADNNSMFSIAANFDSVMQRINGYYSGEVTPKIEALSEDSINRAINYYIERMSYVRNISKGSVHSAIIPLKSSVTMDGISSLYPFQLYTLSEQVLPYRYNQKNLNDRKVAFSISKLVHSFENNQWTTAVDGFMTLLKNQEDYEDQSVFNAPPPAVKTLNATANPGPVNGDTTGFDKAKIQKAITFFKGRGYGKVGTAVVVGNLLQESGLITTVSNKRGSGAYGIAQWLGSRLAQLKTKHDYNSIDVQLAFIDIEMSNTPFVEECKILKTTTDLMTAINAMGFYEFQNSSVQDPEIRLAYSKDILNRIDKGEFGKF